MASKDAITKRYMQNSERFADAFNFLIYGGEQRLKPENLKSLDTTELALPFQKDARPSAVQKMRDILKQAIVMQDDEATYLLLGIENQTQIHYAIPIRNMLYDALQ